jgi:catechol 2,3-dioxygenase-like lactoylglutathione lyase family enzyme
MSESLHAGGNIESEMNPQFDQVIPILRMFSVDKAKEFYVGFLGMNVDWEHRFDEAAPLYMQVSRGNLVLHLSEHHGDGSPGANVFVRMTGLDDYHREITAKGYRYMRPGIEPAGWDEHTRVMGVIDPSGNHLQFIESAVAKS